MSASVRGIGVAVITSTSGCAPFARSVARCMHAEAMLLVDDDQPELVELDRLLGERVRADDEVDRAARELGARISRRFAAVALPVSEATRNRDAIEQPPNRQVVLVRQNLGRRHERDLQAVLHRDERGEQRDDRLAGADVALQQPVHRLRPLHVGDDLAQRRLLSVGELERQHAPRRLADAVVDDHRPRFAIAGVLPLAQHEAGLEQEELLEDQPLLRRRARYAFSASTAVPGGGKCVSGDRLRAIRQRAPRANRGRHRIGQRPRAVPRAAPRRASAASAA